MTSTNPHKEYISSRVAVATPMELTRMLYEGAAQSVQEALAAHRAGDILGRGNAVTKAVEILGELRFSLRREVAPQYGYLQNRLIQAHAEKSESILREVLQLIQTLLEGWMGAMHNLGALDNAAAQHAEPPSSEFPEAALSAPNPYSSRAAEELQNRSWQF